MSEHESVEDIGPKIFRVKRTFDGHVYLSRKWYFRAWQKGRPCYFPLHENAAKARASAKKIRDFLRSGVTTVEEARQRFCGDLLARKARAEVATIGEVLDLLEGKRGAFGLEASSAYAYQNSLTIVVETVLNFRRKGQQAMDRDAIRHESLNVLTRKLLNDFKLIRQDEVRDKGLLQLKSTQRTINKHLRNAKAVFKEGALDVYRDEGLGIPDLSGFLSTPLIPRLGIEYHLPRSAMVQRVTHAIHHDLKERNLLIAAMLALHAGLRADEIVHARWRWLIMEDGLAPFLRVQREDDFEPKNHRCRKIPLQLWFATWLKERLGESEARLLQTTQMERADDILRELAMWLREHEVTVQKPVHELRKWFGSFVVHSTGSLAKAQKILGHRSPQTTQDYYADLEFSPALEGGWTNK